MDESLLLVKYSSGHRRGFTANPELLDYPMEVKGHGPWAHDLCYITGLLNYSISTTKTPYLAKRLTDQPPQRGMR